MNEKILIVEKDPALRGALSAAFEGQGACAVSVAEAQDALHACDAFAPDAAVLGFDPSDPGGARLCAILKRRFRGLRLFLLAERADAGAGDGAPEADGLLARELPARELAGSVLRGAAQSAPPEPEEPETYVVCGPIRLELATQRLYKDGRPVETTRQELSLLRVLMEHADTALSRRELLRLAWGSDYYGHKTVDVHIRRLRRKIEDDPSRPRLIQTVWGFGYRFCKP